MYVYFFLFCARASRGSTSCSKLPRRWAPVGGPAERRLRLHGALLLTFMTSLASFSAPKIFGRGRIRIRLCSPA
jgi:hypothetical protein